MCNEGRGAARDDDARQHARRDRAVVPVAGAESAPRVEGGAGRRHPRSLGDRSRGDQGFRAFLPDHRLRPDRGERTAGRDAALSFEETGLGRNAMAALITTPRLMAIGGGALAELPGLLARLGLQRPLIVTDPYIARCGILDRATALFDGAGIAWSVF